MKKLKSLFLFLSVIFIANMTPSYATDNYIPIRVGISDNYFKNYIFDSVEFLDAYNLNILDGIECIQKDVQVQLIHLHYVFLQQLELQ